MAKVNNSLLKTSGVCAAFALAPVPGVPAFAQSTVGSSVPTTADQIFAYTGADRQKMLEAGAKKEGKVLWYTSEILNQRARPLANLFHQKYPYIDVDIVQLDSGPLLQRSVEEFGAKKYDVDVIEGNLPVALALQKIGALGRFLSPELAGLPQGVIDPNHYFVGDREIPLGIAFNTTIVPEANAPKSLDDLLNPFWKGKLSTNDSVQGSTYFGAMGEVNGQDYLRKLADLQITVYSNMSSNAVTDLVAAGTVVSTFPTSVGQVAVSRQKGAPIAWAPLGKAITILGILEVMSHTAHPHAAALFADFLISQEGQEALVKTQEGGTRIGLANQYGGYTFEKLYFDTSVPQTEYIDDIKKWSVLFNSLLVDQRR